jgi:hypothetical protein
MLARKAALPGTPYVQADKRAEQAIAATLESLIAP